MRRTKLVGRPSKSLIGVIALGAAVAGATVLARGWSSAVQPASTYVVIASNELGMHCMNEDFSEFMVLPPFNSLRAQVIRRGGEPEIITENVTVRYSIPSNTQSVTKTNFWEFAPALFGVTLPPNVGLTGNGLAGTMVAQPIGDYQASGIPLTPIDDLGRENPYPLATVTVESNGQVRARTQAVVPVSWEISCNLCHKAGPGESVAGSILRAHDRLHGTDLVNHKPVNCSSCHADPALGAPGQPGIPNMSAAMHGAHANRMGPAQMLASECYACHPGVRTSCQRDVHTANGISCIQCHGGMAAVAAPGRTPWVTEPRCDSCHQRAGFEFEQPGTLFRDSIGHGGVKCVTCHSSPHAVTPTTTTVDNLQSVRLQGHTGVINSCTVCHTSQPDEGFFHSVEH